MNKFWHDETFIGFDTETSGPYPLTAEICEIAAVKWRQGRIVDRFQSLISVKNRMSDQVIRIHNITNEMLIGAPPLSEVIKAFHQFVGQDILIAHHAPFDMGFIAPCFEQFGLPLPKTNVLCSSLLSRKIYPESVNHKLQTLIQFFDFQRGAAHRALDDAEACLNVALKVFERMGSSTTVNEAYEAQGAYLSWSLYGLNSLRQNPVYAVLIKALETNQMVQIVYSGGSRPGQARTVIPKGLVRNPLDDYFLAVEKEGEVAKRYFLNKITAARF